MSALYPDGAPIDADHLKRMTLGDPRLEHEVLSLFSAQAADSIAALAVLPSDAAALAHKLKGSARAIGAFGVAAAVEHFEGIMREGGNIADSLTLLTLAVAEARAAIDETLRRA